MLRENSFWLRHKKLIIILLSLILCVGVFIAWRFLERRRGIGAVNAAERETAKASIGNITSSITGSGTIVSSATKNISSEVSADVLSVNVSVGDKVSKGDVLLELDKTTYDTKIRELNKNITKLASNVSSYKQDINNLYVYATKSGYVSDLNLDVGDSVNKNSTILQITNDEYYYISCQVNYNTGLTLKVGDLAKVMLVDTLTYLDGEISYVSDLKEISDSGTPLQTVEVKIKNPGYTLDGLLASVTLGSGTSAVKAVKNVNITSTKSSSFKAQVSGTVESLYVRNGDYINTGDLIMILKNDDLKENLNDAVSSLNDAYEDLNNEKENLDFYTIIAPIDGVVTSINVSSGDYVRSESNLLTIVNNDNVEFDIEVDELDINDVTVGAEVKVTIDALEETASSPLTGYVTNVSIEGNSMNSVTSYPVTISLEGNDKIKMGMNCSAEIIIQSKENVLTVPVEAVNSRKGEYYVSLTDGSEKKVEVGLYDDTNIEIVSGLTEGDEVYLPITVKASSNNVENDNSSFGGFDFGGGGMPGGNFGGNMGNGGPGGNFGNGRNGR